MGFLRLLEGIRVPALNGFFSLATYGGSEIFLIGVMLVVCWCCERKKAYYMMAVGFSSILVNQVLKIVCRIPRPWVRDPDFTIVESAREGAGGYSFPSGHTQNVTALGGALARGYKNKVLRVVCAVLIVLVGFSRMYLGVHTPADVLTGLVISLVFVFALYPLFEKYGDSTRAVVIIFSVLGVLALAAVLFMELYPWPADTDADNLAEAVKSAYMMLGCALGCVIAVPIERKYIRYETAAPLWVQVVKCAVGMAIVVLLRTVLKAPLIALFAGNIPLAAGVRYMILILFAMLVWPLTFRFLPKK